MTKRQKLKDANQHATVRLYYDTVEDYIDVDVHIAPLLAAMWQLGIDTLSSCQASHENGRVWIMFPNERSAGLFLQLGALGAVEPVRWGGDIDWAGKPPWTWKATPSNRVLGQFFIHVTFPREDLPVLLEVLTSAYDARRPRYSDEEGEDA